MYCLPRCSHGYLRADRRSPGFSRVNRDSSAPTLTSFDTPRILPNGLVFLLALGLDSPVCLYEPISIADPVHCRQAESAGSLFRTAGPLRRQAETGIVVGPQVPAP